MKAVEDEAEVVRPPDLPSRKIAVFATPTPATVRSLLASRAGSYLYEVKVPENALHSGPLDMRHIHYGLSGIAIAAAAKSYWQGAPCGGRWEILAVELEVVDVFPAAFAADVRRIALAFDLDAKDLAEKKVAPSKL